jgi:trigger factor
MVEETQDQGEQEQVDPAARAAEGSGETEAAETHLPENKLTVEDAGTLKKKVTVQVPRERVDAKFDEMFGELRQSAAVPGFRVGRAPRRLIEKRFGKEVAEDVRNALVGEAVGSALEKQDLKVIGQPDIKLDEIKLPEEGEFSFDFEVEVAPDFELPEYKGIEIRRPPAEVTDERVEEALTSYLRSAGRLRPTDSAAEAGDVVVANISITGDGVEHSLRNSELRVAPAQVEGIPLEDLPQALLGSKAGQSASLKAKVPSAHPNEAWRDKEVTISFELQEVKRLELPELDEELARQAGFASVEELRQAVAANLQSRLAAEQQRAMRDQVCAHLLENASFDVPEGVASRHAARLLARRYVDLMLRGVPREQIEQNMEQLEAAAGEQATRDLKLTFVLSKLAEAEGVEVEDGEVNARIAQIARQQKRRPERFRQELTNEGTLDHLVTAIREEKAIEKVLASAKIADAAEGDEPAEAKAPQAKAKRAAPRKKKPARKKQ